MTANELKVIVRTNIKRYREFRKWTQAQLAEKLNISINFLSDIENGKKWISPESMVKIASTFNIEPFELFKPANVPEPSVFTFFSRYNDEVVQAVSESLDRIYNYYAIVLTDEKLQLGGEGAGTPGAVDNAELYGSSGKPESHRSAAEEGEK